ncbi:hypothetical protein HMPREF0663_11219 [Hoylesella oralis ATCC 33269]|uniref:Outer membrane protein beta-barrel domain-containing protein n=1 Tax=Hoylesella oralis ATCC 33269 TaxID=873533 RepID=E7RPW8_9BACT|nr:outer membrane beta-barrel protein [Hoylesella oralis]EFZ37161.1 hypothetical protein HMPREF0663_11219 [Hoylesella oralis ATCC 33269]EPH16224.1 hypothetical protein HMPREF1475_01967 [Hoylesella oralis HGA0225]SHF83633.1 Outer membrane protein beta-barrel domain-containing protein [Hoylesella oralis]
MKEQWRKEMQQKLAGYRQPAPEVSWAEVEKAVAKSKRSATQIPLVWRRIAAAAMIIFICGSGFILYYRHADKPHTSNTASLNRGQTVSPATPTAAPITPTLASSTGSAGTASPARHAPTGNTTVTSATQTAATEIPHLANNTTQSTDATVQDSPSEKSVTIVPAPHKQETEKKEQQHNRPQRQQYPSYPVPMPEYTPSTTADNRLMASAFVSNVATAQNHSANNVPMLAAADPIGMHGKDMDGKGTYAVMNRENDIHTEVHHRQPVRFGLSLRYNINDRWSIEGGVSYTYLASDISRKSEAYAYKTKQKLSYMGIPVNVNYRLWSNRWFNLYASGGGTVEKMVKGKATTNTIVDDKVSAITDEDISMNRLQFSATGAIGAEFKVDKRFSIFAEPGLSYYFDNKSSVATIYQDKPLNFNLNIGIRLNIK